MRTKGLGAQDAWGPNQAALPRAQAVYAGKKATLTIGNIKPIGEMPEGAIICNVEEVRRRNMLLRSQKRMQDRIVECIQEGACGLSRSHWAAWVAGQACRRVAGQSKRLCRAGRDTEQEGVAEQEVLQMVAGLGCLTWLRAAAACEQKAGDRGAIARASGDYAIVVAHNPESGVTRIKLPSGQKKARRCTCPARLRCFLQPFHPKFCVS
jgi:hypothetical protein